jgi:hypothetical protein
VLVSRSVYMQLIVLQTATFAIHDLCIHPEYVAPIRRELESEAYAEFEKTARGLPLLDSFVKESARLTPVESRTCCSVFSPVRPHPCLIKNTLTPISTTSPVEQPNTRGIKANICMIK